MGTETKHFITEHDAITGDTVVREMTEQEYAQYEADIANYEPLPSVE
jgi:hypothetical protein